MRVKRTSNILEIAKKLGTVIKPVDDTRLNTLIPICFSIPTPESYPNRQCIPLLFSLRGGKHETPVSFFSR